MNCPNCEKEMKRGYVQSARQVFFTTHLHHLFFRAGKDEVVLTTHNWTTPTAQAWCCEDCKQVIVKYY